MEIALVDGVRKKAQPGLSGVCPACDKPVFARCGRVRVHHWAHHEKCEYERWLKNEESEWHRAWKGMFPENWREHTDRADSGERHRADVKTDQGWVLEFQHSRIDPDERKAREAFYRKLIWIVDGARLESDKVHFFKAWSDGEQVSQRLQMRRISLPNKSALLRDWDDSRVPVFFDFSWCDEPEDTQLSLIDSSGGNNLEAQLWCLLRVIDGMAYVVPFPQALLIEYHSPEPTKLNIGFAQHLQGLLSYASEIARPGPKAPSKQYVRPKPYQMRQRPGPREWYFKYK